MNRFKSILLGGLLAAASIAALSQNANAAEFQSDHDHFNRNTVAFNNSKLVRERQFRSRQFRERQARLFRERQARLFHERQARLFHERQARLFHERQARERQAHFHY